MEVDCAVGNRKEMHVAVANRREEYILGNRRWTMLIMIDYEPKMVLKQWIVVSISSKQNYSSRGTGVQNTAGPIGQKKQETPRPKVIHRPRDTSSELLRIQTEPCSDGRDGRPDLAQLDLGLRARTRLLRFRCC